MPPSGMLSPSAVSMDSLDLVSISDTAPTSHTTATQLSTSLHTQITACSHHPGSSSFPVTSVIPLDSTMIAADLDSHAGSQWQRLFSQISRGSFGRRNRLRRTPGQKSQFRPSAPRRRKRPKVSQSTMRPRWEMVFRHLRIPVGRTHFLQRQLNNSEIVWVVMNSCQKLQTQTYQ